MKIALRSCGRTIQWLATALLTVGTACAADKAVYPSKPIRFVVPFAAGGGTDIMARAVAQKYIETWGQSVIVDNRAGGNGNIGTDVVAKALPDGYTLCFTTNATIVVNPNLLKLPYDPVKDFAPVSLAATLPFVLVAHPSLPAKSVTELIALAKAKPGQLNFGSSGGGGGAHLSGEMLKTMSGIDITHVPYRGGAPGLVAVLGGEVPFMFISILTVTPLLESGRLRPLAVTSAKRSPSLPNVPAMAETPGLAGFETDLWYGLLAPAKTAPAIVDQLYRETKRALLLPDIRGRFEPTGTVMVGSTPQEFGEVIKSDLVKWRRVIKTSGAKMD
jgi:tripartite-type tricarboxylate transporter receptor subunit TctC